MAKVHIHKFKGDVKAIGEDILVTNMYFGDEKSAGGIIIGNDNGKVRGIKARWCQVFDIGHRSKLKDLINIGDWIMLEHGRWSRGIKIQQDGEEFTIRRADPEAIMMISDEQPEAETISTSVHAERKTREYA